MKYVCLNPDCKRYKVEDELTKESFHYEGGELVGEHADCPCCGRRRKFINPNEDIPLSQKETYYGKYSSASPQERREMLKKRAHEDYNKHVKERKDYLIHEAVRQFQDTTK